MKRIVVALIVGTMFFSAACSSTDNSAKGKYNAFIKKYEPALNDLQDAFGGSHESFEEYVAGEGCEPFDDESAGLAAVFLGPVLAKHNLSVVDFVKDLKDVLSTIKAEGLCGKSTTTTTTAPVVKTGPSSSLCAELTKKVDDYLADSQSDPLSFDKSYFNQIFAAEQEACRA